MGDRVTGNDDQLIAARRVLLDALDILAAHVDSLVLIGAQAIYEHTGPGSLFVPPTTTDADFALDGDLLGSSPEIASLLASAGFKVGQPGHWVNAQGLAVDLMVAPHQSGRRKASARAAHLEHHSNDTARIGPGLAAAITDNSLCEIVAFDPGDPRRRSVRVAGPGALLVAKVIKINDRLGDAARGQQTRVIDKDALDLLRILQAVSTEDLADSLRQHAPESAAGVDTATALRVVREDLDGAQRIGELAQVAALGDPTTKPSYVALAGELLHTIRT